MATFAAQEETNVACDKEDRFRRLPAGRGARGVDDGWRTGLPGRIGGGDEPARKRWDMMVGWGGCGSGMEASNTKLTNTMQWKCGGPRTNFPPATAECGDGGAPIPMLCIISTQEW